MYGEGVMQAGLIGRGAELRAVTRLLDGAVVGRTGLVLGGEPGIGKTAILEAAIERARGRGYRVLSARPAAAESSLPLSGFGDLFLASAAELLARLPDPQRPAVEAALLLGDPVQRPADQRTLAVATTTMLSLLSDREPVLIAVDDAQWLDAGSIALLSYALRRLADRRIGLVAAVRRSSADGRVLGVDTWLEPDRLEVIQVGPLTVAALHRLVSDRTGTSFSRLAIVRIHAESGGNPFYALEIARALTRAGERVTPTSPLPIPDTLAELTSDRIRALPARTRGALLVAALALEPPSLDVLSGAGVTDPRLSSNRPSATG